jgi:hypothetical protein
MTGLGGRGLGGNGEGGFGFPPPGPGFAGPPPFGAGHVGFGFGLFGSPPGPSGGDVGCGVSPAISMHVHISVTTITGTIDGQLNAPLSKSRDWHRDRFVRNLRKVLLPDMTFLQGMTSKKLT